MEITDTNGRQGKIVLGIDLGSSSVGWALVRETCEGEACGLAGAGVRIFDAGVEGTADTIAAGRDEARGKGRRDARSRRRLLQRRAMRLHRVATELQTAGLLPEGDVSTPEGRKAYFDALDISLADGQPDAALLPYRLRARALDGRLSPHEIGRAIYHLAQRRGFRSNRKEVTDDKKKKEEEGEVKAGIAEIAARMKEAGARTLGELFASLDPHVSRIRKHYTSRQMYQEEFGAIWTAQQALDPAVFNEEARIRIERAVFHQRPLKTQKHLIGTCELEPGSRRAPMAILDAQRFRLLQAVNNLMYDETDLQTGEIKKVPLTPEQRKTLIDELEKSGDLTFPKIRKLFGFKSGKNKTGVKFNLEEGDNERIIGNRTAAKLAGMFGEEKWGKLTREEKDAVVHDLLSIQKDEALFRRGVKRWGLDEEAAKKFSEYAPEDTRCSLSRAALKKVLPLLEEGKHYETARIQIYGDKPAPKPAETLPPLCKADMPEVRNPAVTRALSELRKVVNAVIREHGLPDEIRIELARDLKKTRKQREAAWKRGRANEKKRNAAKAEMILKEVLAYPSRSDIEKWLLAEECNWRCPYTDNPIAPGDLFGPMPLFDVEHIVPFSRSFDNSFINKTLCEATENRLHKRNRTPGEAYRADAKRWDDIIQKVEKFKGDCRDEKLRRFKMLDTEDIEGFASRQLNDTRYSSKLAIRYLGTLYGAGADGNTPDGRKALQPGRGQVTSYLRDEWGLNDILGDGGAKNRGDHRAHAIDAICIALTTPGVVKMMSDAAERATYERRRRFAPVPEPWPGFHDDVKGAVEKMAVSHRVTRQANSALHEETHYSKPQTSPDGKACRHIRKNIASLTPAQVKNIVDDKVRQLVEEKIALLGDIKKLEHEENWPCFISKKDGRKIPIRKARIRVSGNVETVARGTARERNIMPGANHHIEIFEAEIKGKVKWEGRIVTMLEAARRANKKQVIVDREPGEDFPGAKFKFSLSGGEIVEMDDEKTGKRGLFVVRTICGPMVAFVRIHDARKKDEILKSKDFIQRRLDPMRKTNCRKVSVTPLGEVVPAND